MFFYNFREYDSHLILHEFPNLKDRKPKVIAFYIEKYLQIEWEPNIMFCDSLQLLSALLDSLVKSIAKSGRHNFVHLHEKIQNFVPNVTDEMLKLVEQMEVFCYDYIDKFERHAES